MSCGDAAAVEQGALYIRRPQILEILDPPCPHFTQPISTFHMENWQILETPLHSDIICAWSLTSLLAHVIDLNLNMGDLLQQLCSQCGIFQHFPHSLKGRVRLLLLIAEEFGQWT